MQRLLAQHDAGVDHLLQTPVYGIDSEPRPNVPARIGRYRILRVIGEGGMGVVYEAEQEHPHRKVALKVIRAGAPSRAILRRFQHEAEILGQLQHVGIAHIYEASTAEVDAGQGSRIVQPYFAMEYIDGKPLTQYADTEALNVKQRLVLLARICDAVQHAHQKGVIHRDLKPGNILVDVTGQPKILDFGVARATDSDMQTVTMQTDIGQLIGTVPYMSPEQVTGDSRKVDTRSDVYALGVILYELVSGRLPYDVRDRSILDAARVIQDEEPPRLSMIDRSLRGEIEVIIHKALEKDKERRYQSASDLGSDIRRHLGGEPIDARRDSRFYVHSQDADGGTVSWPWRRSWCSASRLRLRWFPPSRRREIGDLPEANGVPRETAVKVLRASNIARGRLLAQTGHFVPAEDLIWEEFLSGSWGERRRLGAVGALCAQPGISRRWGSRGKRRVSPSRLMVS